MADETKAGAARVLEHGTAKTRAAEGKKAEGEKGPKGKKGKKRIRRMTIEPAESGGYVVRHEHQPPEGAVTGVAEGHPDETHVVADTEGLKNHIEQHLGGGGPTETAAEGEAAEAPAEEEAAAAAGGG